MQTRALSTVSGLSLSVLFAAACSSAPSSYEESTAQVSARISVVPPQVACIELDVAGARTVTQRFDVVSGQSPVLNMTGLPTGSVQFTGLAYPSACSAVSSTAEATWLSPPTGATLAAGTVTNIALTLYNNGEAAVTIGFVGDDAGASEAGTPCASGQVVCGGVCTSVASDPGNCGACGLACSGPANSTPSCVSGTCVLTCNAGYTNCGGSCVELGSSITNCGSCGFVCEGAQNALTRCVSGTCTISCVAGYTSCGGACANVATDPNNCGSCGKACAAGHSCTAGTCQ